MESLTGQNLLPVQSPDAPPTKILLAIVGTLPVPENLLTVLDRLTQGVYVIGVSHLERKNAFTASWVTQSSLDPPMLALGIAPTHKSYALLSEGGFFTVNVLGKGHGDMALHFGTPMKEDKLAGAAWHEARCGAPILDAAIAWFECEVVAKHPSGDHMLVLGKVIRADLVDPEGLPLTYGDVRTIDPSRRMTSTEPKPLG
jgi:flavin reductase (DIM6/NTAB) family NADH-FMN oxidoreductase RutF